MLGRFWTAEELVFATITKANVNKHELVNCESSIKSCFKRLKKFRILVLYRKELITEIFSIKFKVILSPPLDVCLLFVLLFTIFIIVVSSSAVQKRH